MTKPKPKCVHYWDINFDNVGTCRYCGEVKKYPATNFEVEDIKKKQLQAEKNRAKSKKYYHEKVKGERNG